MRLVSRKIASLLLAATAAAPVFMAGCVGRGRVYDPYYHDYHSWNAEAPYYQHWEQDTHRDHEDYNKRSAAEQKEYWDSRHNQH